MEPLYYQEMDTPLGELILAAGEDSLRYVDFLTENRPDLLRGQDMVCRNTPVLELATKELRAYFDGTLRKFTVPCTYFGSDFQVRVWKELTLIPFGKTISYEELAGRVGQPRAYRAVGHANNRNPLAIIVPCHRVIGKDGRLVGYGGGVERKAWLLEWERKCLEEKGISLTC